MTTFIKECYDYRYDEIDTYRILVGSLLHWNSHNQLSVLCCVNSLELYYYYLLATFASSLLCMMVLHLYCGI